MFDSKLYIYDGAARGQPRISNKQGDRHLRASKARGGTAHATWEGLGDYWHRCCTLNPNISSVPCGKCLAAKPHRDDSEPAPKSALEPEGKAGKLPHPVPCTDRAPGLSPVWPPAAGDVYVHI